MLAGEKVKNPFLLLTTSQRVTEALEDSSLSAIMFGQCLNESDVGKRKYISEIV